MPESSNEQTHALLEEISLDGTVPQENDNTSPSSPSSTSSTKPAQEVIEQEQDIILRKYIDACQTGDLMVVTDLIESGAIEVGSDVDVNNVSGLHWAAINNRLSIVKYLISKNAEIDKEGGDLKATPLHWACRYGLVYIVDQLLKSGADPTKVDSQGFNALHLAVHSSNIMLVIYVLEFAQQIFIDETDPNGRTALHWASYQGDSLTVDVLLKFKASVRKVDDQGFTPIHWGLIRSQKECLKRLLEEGSDIYQKTNDGKNCFDIAKDMNSIPVFHKALYEAGFNIDGTPINKVLDSKWAKLFTFFYPYFLIGVVIKLISSLHVLISLPLLVALYYASTVLFKKYIFPCFILLSSPMLKSPFLSGLFSGTTFWVIIVWFTTLLPSTFTRAPISNFLFLVFCSSVIYFFRKAMFKDPGRIDPPSSDKEVREIIDGLLLDGLYDAKHFCIHTFIKKPLRSKYSSFSERCVARFDHYCPWVYNEVGLRNHKIFIFFVISLEIAMVLFVRLTLEHFDQIEDDDLQCSLLDDELCSGFIYSRFTFFLAAWTSFQIIWVTFLLFSQFFQITKGITSLELSVVTSRSDLGANPYYSSAPSELGSHSPPPSSGSGHGHAHSHRTCLSTLCLLTGLDQFRIAVKQTFGFQSNETFTEIPFDYGVKQNCIDFWFASGDDRLKLRNLLKEPAKGEANLGGEVVDYYKLYELPRKKIAYENQV